MKKVKQNVKQNKKTSDFVGSAGFEPAINRLWADCSAAELRAPGVEDETPTRHHPLTQFYHTCLMGNNYPARFGSNSAGTDTATKQSVLEFLYHYKWSQLLPSPRDNARVDKICKRTYN